MDDRSVLILHLSLGLTVSSDISLIEYKQSLKIIPGNLNEAAFIN
jgi:hypothetical protein